MIHVPFLMLQACKYLSSPSPTIIHNDQINRKIIDKIFLLLIYYKKTSYRIYILSYINSDLKVIVIFFWYDQVIMQSEERNRSLLNLKQQDARSSQLSEIKRYCIVSMQMQHLLYLNSTTYELAKKNNYICIWVRTCPKVG